MLRHSGPGGHRTGLTDVNGPARAGRPGSRVYTPVLHLPYHGTEHAILANRMIGDPCACPVPRTFTPRARYSG